MTKKTFTEKLIEITRGKPIWEHMKMDNLDKVQETNIMKHFSPSDLVKKREWEKIKNKHD